MSGYAPPPQGFYPPGAFPGGFPGGAPAPVPVQHVESYVAKGDTATIRAGQPQTFLYLTPVIEKVHPGPTFFVVIAHNWGANAECWSGTFTIGLDAYSTRIIHLQRAGPDGPQYGFEWVGKRLAIVSSSSPGNLRASVIVA